MSFFSLILPSLIIFLTAAGVCLSSSFQVKSFLLRNTLQNLAALSIYMLCLGLLCTYFFSWQGPGTNAANAGKSHLYFMLCGLPLAISNAIDEHSYKTSDWMRQYYLVAPCLLVLSIFLFACGIYNAYAQSGDAAIITTVATSSVTVFILLLAFLAPLLV